MNSDQPLIFLIDDQSDSLQILGKTLKRLNCELSFAESSHEALLKLEKIKPDLILLDVIMPDMDGFSLMEKFRSMSDIKNVPIIFLSAMNDTDSIVRGFRLGCVNYITKPFIIEEVISIIENQLRIKRTNDLLNRYKNKLEEMVKDRTKELEDKNTALNVLLQKLEEDKIELRKNINLNIKNLILPYLKKIRASCSERERSYLLDLIETNLGDIILSFGTTFSDKYQFTVTEIQIVNLILTDKTSKEISNILNKSDAAIAFHRKNIREKLDIKNTKVNLQNYLRQLMRENRF